MTDTLLRQFADWVQTKDPSEEYDWHNVRADCVPCAIGQFAIRHGGDLYSRLSEEAWDGLHSNNLAFDAARAEPWTMGALAERLAPYTTMAQTIKDCKPILVPLRRGKIRDI